MIGPEERARLVENLNVCPGFDLLRVSNAISEPGSGWPEVSGGHSAPELASYWPSAGSLDQ